MTINCRRTHADDLTILADLWHENLTILASADRRFQPRADAGLRWKAEATAWMQDQACALWTVCADERPVGFALGVIQPALPGMAYEQIGAITAMVIDPHGYYGGAARQLVDALRAWFRERGVHRVVVYVPHRAPAEQAFWRASGASEWMDGLWLK
jgi:GNAT superfamily N-acetyltransferase